MYQFGSEAYLGQVVLCGDGESVNIHSPLLILLLPRGIEYLPKFSQNASWRRPRIDYLDLQSSQPIVLSMEEHCH